MKLRKLVVGVAATTAAVALGGGVAMALWTTSGTGGGTGAADVAQSLVVTAVTPGGSGASLYPGGPAGFVYFTVQNPNPFAVHITGFTWGTPVSANPTACPSANFTVDPGAPTTTSLPIAAASQSGAFQVFNVVDLALSAPNGCQGVDVTVPVTVSATQG
jgi:hypothetical protein